MTTIHQQQSNLATVVPSVPYDAQQASGGAEPAEPGIGETLMRLHVRMRGRYLLTLILAVLLAVGLGYAGYMQGGRTYRSIGQIRIVPTLPRVMYATEDKGVMPMFDSFVQTQVSLIRTQRVIDLALEDPSWPSPPRRGDPLISEFASRLNVARDNEIIAVTFDSPDPLVAQAAVRSVIAAYRKLYIEADGRENEQVLTQLTQRQTSLSSEMASNRGRIRAIAERYNTDQIDGIFAAKQKQVHQIESDLATARADQMRFLEELSNAPGDRSPETFANSDQILGKLVEEQVRKQLELNALLAQYGPGHAAVVKARQMLAGVNSAIDERVEKLVKRNGGGSPTAPTRFQVMIDRLSEQLAVEQEQLKNIGRDQFALADLKREATDLTERLNQTKTRIEELTTEAPVATGRVTVVSDGNLPAGPSKDTRKTYAGMGVVVGFCLPFGLALLLSSMSQKFATPVETGMNSITRDLVLGALPVVDESKFDADASSLAAHCLHQVRTMLQIRCNGRAKVIAITSARAGSGKTSVVLGLGVSYAMAGSKTLLMDLDLMSGGLTRRAEIESRARLGSLLIGQGLITDEQLQGALELAKSKQIKLGEAFIEAGYLREDQLDAILHRQRRNRAGLMDALYGKTLLECVSGAGMDNLDILPLGSANPQDAATLSPTEIKSLIEEAKRHYDTVLIDTGPVPGSLEASMVASLTDGVLLVISRGEARSGAERSLEHLSRVGGRVVGLVFNRAKPSDVTLIAGAKYGSGFLPADRVPLSAARQAVTARFGPVGQAVLDLSPTNLN